VVDEKLKKAVFLDRDGVLNSVLLKDGKPYPPESLEELSILPGVHEAINAFKKLQFEIVVVTNQPDVARGKSSEEKVNLIHEYLGSSLGIENFYACLHDDVDECSCRKPLPGMIVEAAMRIGIDLARSYMIGDRWRDIEAGQLAGCICYFIDYSYLEKRPSSPFISVGSLFEAAKHIERRESVYKSE
jgi:D-glycero-D-manno-heptose 1,7-bisphosphate phosphatase